MTFDIATFKINIRRHRSTLFNFPELFYKNYAGYRSIKHGHADFTITIVPYDPFSFSFKKFVKRQNHFYYEKKDVLFIKSPTANTCVNTATKKMTLGFKGKSSERNKIAVLLAFVRLSVSLCAVLKGGLPFHSSALAFGNKGIAFSGPSGAGKSTIAKLLAMPGQLLNDDFSIILPLEENAFKIYSTPFTQPETLEKCVNRSAKLRAIFFLEKSKTNKIEPLSFKNKYILTLGQTFMFPLSDFFGKKILDNAERLCGCVECKRLHFKNDNAIRPFMYHYAGGLR